MFTGGIEMTEGAPYAIGKYSKVSASDRAEKRRQFAAPVFQPSTEPDPPEAEKPPEQEEIETYPEKPPSYIWLSILCLFYNVVLGLLDHFYQTMHGARMTDQQPGDMEE